MWPFSSNLDSVLRGTKKVKVKGVVFRIKKIDPLNYLDGSKSILKMYDTYEGKRKSAETATLSDADLKKAREHYRDVLLAGVVSPKLVRKIEDTDGYFVDNLFLDWDLVNKLYTEIMVFTYGKKKLVT